MSKKVSFPKKPAHPPALPANDHAAALDAFVGVEQPRTPASAPAEKMKRFTFDVPESLHRRVKSQCAAKGVDMADELRQLLEQRFPA